MTLILPTSADWSSFNLPDGLGYVDGQLVELVHPELWQGCVGAWSHALDSHPWDYSGNGGHASRNSDIGDTATGWRLNGTTSKLTVPTRPSLKPGTGNMTWVFRWSAQAVAAPVNDDILSDRALGSLGAVEGFVFGRSGNIVELFDVIIECAGGSAKNYRYNSQPALNQTCVMVVTWNNSADQMRLYKNATLLTPDSMPVNSTLSGLSCANTTDVIIGGRPGTNDRNWNSTVDEVLIFNRVLSLSEIVAFNSPNAAYLCRPMRRWFVVPGTPAASAFPFHRLYQMT